MSTRIPHSLQCFHSGANLKACSAAWRKGKCASIGYYCLRAFRLSDFCSFSFSAGAQNVCGGIEGRVTTVEGWLIPHVTIRSVNKLTKQSDNVRTDDKGEYAACLPPGTYDIFATALGFKPMKRKSLKIDAASRAIIDFTMKRGKPVTSHARLTHRKFLVGQ
jgi:hypothetical protein